MAGSVITFYSANGGTGRSMAVSNIAWILASNGYRVLAIDWNLESPGLHCYLRPFLPDAELRITRGLIDFLDDAIGAPNARSPALHDYVIDLKWTFRTGGSLALLPAGRQDQRYPERIGAFDRYLDRGPRGDNVIAALRDRLKASYDFVLIDSRTGLGDTGGVCAMQMPDTVVLFFTLNHHSMRGAAQAAAAIRAKRGERFPLFPIPARVERGETDKLAAAMNYARNLFAPYLLHVQSDTRGVDVSQQVAYWRDVETPYVSFYAFEELPAPFKDESGSRRGLLAPHERLASRITDGAVTSLYPEEAEQRRRLVDAYAFAADAPPKAIDRPPNTPILDFLTKVRAKLRRDGWRLATKICAGLIILMSVLWVVDPPALQDVRRAIHAKWKSVVEPDSPKR